jgi:hypothetical protein
MAWRPSTLKLIGAHANRKYTAVLPPKQTPVFLTSLHNSKSLYSFGTGGILAEN